MTKEWDTHEFDNFHNTMKKYTKNTLSDLKTISKKQQAFGATKEGAKSETFEGARHYMNEVHSSIVISLNRALDEHARVLGKLENDFEDTVDSASKVKINTEDLERLNKDTDRKVEDIYQAHAGLQKQINICASETTTGSLDAPSFAPLEKNANNIHIHLTKVENDMHQYDLNHANAFNQYQKLIAATRKAIEAARTNYTAPNGAMRYTQGAFGVSPEGKGLSNANYELEQAKLADLYQAEGNRLDNMEDYANELMQDPERLEQEMAYLKYLIENRAFPDAAKERNQLSAFYYLLIQLQTSKNKAKILGVGDNFRVNQIEIVKTGTANVELNVACQRMSPDEFEKYYKTYVNPSNGTKDAERKRYLNETLVIKHFGDNVDSRIDNDENATLSKQIEANKGNWSIPLVKYGIGFIPVVGQVVSVVETTGEMASSYSQNERIQNKITKDNLVNTAAKFGMTCTITTNTTEIVHTTDIVINPTKETNDIMKRWTKLAKAGENEELTFPENKDYLQLFEFYGKEHDKWSDNDEEYIFEGR
ncbi:hypothetical protein IA933_08165 [Listeria marthii]|uniref:T7SS effector LXG polymorphic toxin n=1 Tax=Listeria marthii TaxID=529731 RepID=UPI00188934E7|nr:T7SS effector LXG polymorphic toxin [Listeria marthii]MBF2588867.1 hypothetical protein [Listeria marthii]